jgi:type II secretory pathway pseudopilin PulG
MASSLTLSALSTATRKRKQSEELASVAVKREKWSGAQTDAIKDDDDSDWSDCSSTLSDNRVADRYYSDAGPATPDALAQHLANLQHVSYAIPAHAISTSAGQSNGTLFDRPNPLVAWKPRQRTVHAHQEPYHQRQTTGRFYTQDSSIGKTRPSFFSSNPNVRAQVILMMETTLGKEHHEMIVVKHALIAASHVSDTSKVPSSRSAILGALVRGAGFTP